MLTIDGDVWVANSYAGGVALVHHTDLIRCSLREGEYFSRNSEVVGDDPLVPVTIVGAEVLVDDLANAHTVDTLGADDHLLRIESFLVRAAAHQTSEYQDRPDQQ